MYLLFHGDKLPTESAIVVLHSLIVNAHEVVQVCVVEVERELVRGTVFHYGLCACVLSWPRRNLLRHVLGLKLDALVVFVLDARETRAVGCGVASAIHAAQQARKLPAVLFGGL